jgi:hypothetical protein
MGVYDPLDTFLQCRRAEIDEEAHAQIKHPQIGQELLGVNGSELLEGLELHDHSALYEQIEP